MSDDQAIKSVSTASATGGPTGPGGSGDGNLVALPAGYTLNEYRIDRVLGGGGFGITYLAEDTLLSCPVALKEYLPGDVAVRTGSRDVRPRSDADSDAFNWGLQRFLDEARALATFHNPNIVRVLRYFQANSTAYMVMEYESGHSLKEWAAANPGLDRTSVLRIVRPLLDGLDVIHKAGFLHRDIKPDNIYIRADGTPVLLDFGAARRVAGGGRTLTTIVSPGFAPFEQYHSHGNQGPWSDIYSLSAVMYWLVTGKKPVEAAARIRQDVMTPASRLADTAVFSRSLLRAIDWGMDPDENKRPRNVADFRAVFLAVQPADPGAEPAAAQQRSTASGTFDATPSIDLSEPRGTAERKTFICTVVFVDIVEYSKQPDSQQLAVKSRFNEMLGEVVKAVPAANRIILDTGDGAALCFLGDPEDALQAANTLRQRLDGGGPDAMALRIGVNLGPVKVVRDINGHANVIGDGINTAQRVMSFADPDQILVSRSFFDVVSCLTRDAADCFRYLGYQRDKHGREHEVYLLDSNCARDEERQQGATHTHTATLSRALPTMIGPDALAAVETRLAHYIGPMARVLVRKAAQRAATLDELTRAVAASIPAEDQRIAFMSGGSTVTRNLSHTRAQPHGASDPRSSSGGHGHTRGDPGHVSSPSHTRSNPNVSGHTQGFSPTRAGHTADFANTRAGHAQSGHSRAHDEIFNHSRAVDTPPAPVPESRSRSLSGSRTAGPLRDEDIAAVAHQLALYLGPMAKVLVKKAAKTLGTLDELRHAVASHIDNPKDREKFLAGPARR